MPACSHAVDVVDQMLSTCVMCLISWTQVNHNHPFSHSVSSSQEDDYSTQSWLASIIILHQNRQALIKEQKALSWINRFMVLVIISLYMSLISLIHQLHSKQFTVAIIYTRQVKEKQPTRRREYHDRFQPRLIPKGSETMPPGLII